MRQDLNRRNFLRSAAASLVLPAASAAPAAPVIDTHIHFYNPRRKDGIPWPPKSDTVLYKPVLPHLFAETAGPLGVKGAVVIEANSRPEDNQCVLDLVKKTPMILAFVANLEAGTESFRANLAALRKDSLVRGIRLFDRKIIAGVSQPAFMEDVKRLADAGLSRDAIGVGAGDYDNDGFTDLFVTGVNGNVLYHNNGDGTFRDVTVPAGLGGLDPKYGRMWAIAAGWFDYDNDGYLDLFVTNYVQWTAGADGCTLVNAPYIVIRAFTKDYRTSSSTITATAHSPMFR